MSFLNPKTQRSGILAGIYLVNAVVAPLTIFYAVSISIVTYHIPMMVNSDSVSCMLTSVSVDHGQHRWWYKACLRCCYC